ncbi:MAG: ABC transporter substrate-binding protein [Lachnospiraceae bacterium]|nr:ABC transporter substrate-binding protein [Lachnospiraceae bacterium]
MKKATALWIAACMAAGLMTGTAAADETEKKNFVFGDTTFNAENEEANINPHEAYCGWACLRYGVGETLFKIQDDSTLAPWLAEGYELVDENTWKITMKEGVCFSNGKPCDAQAVKASLEHLIEVHDRARGDLKIASMEAEGNVLTIVTESTNPTLLNYLSEAYGCVIDMEEGITEDGMVVGTGPYVAVELVTDDHLNLVKNENYWADEVKVDEVTVRTISNGDTLALALQSGEIDAAYGMAYASYPLFENDAYTFTGIQTSRSFYCQMNFQSEIIQDDAVRKAIAMGIDKEGFVGVLLNGYGYVGKGAFPETFPFGGQNVDTQTYDPEGAMAVLEEAGWVDTDGDGIREKDGVELEIKWLTYPSRQELPLLAESAQASLKAIGINMIPNVTADHNSIWKDPTQWDVYAAANVNCGLGDPMNFFSTHCLDASTKNRGQYHNDRVEELAAEMYSTFDSDERAALTIEMQQELLDDNAFIFCSFLRMSMISKASVTGLTAHTCDFYELTSDLDIE